MSSSDRSIFFSIVSTAYNQGDNGFIAELIDSVRGQEPGDYTWEHIIVDDGSVDSTADVIQGYAASDSRIRYVYQENAGAALAYERGIREVAGDYVVLIDGDDKLTHDSLAVRAAFLLENPGTKLLYGKGVHFYEEGLLPEDSPFQSVDVGDNQYEKMFLENFIHWGTGTIDADALRTVEWSPVSVWSQDYYLWLELLRPERGIAAVFIDRELMLYRRHGQGATTEMTPERLTKMRRAVSDIRALHLERNPGWWYGEQVAKLHNRLTEYIKFSGEQSDLIIDQQGTIETLHGWVADRDAAIDDLKTHTAMLEERIAAFERHPVVRVYRRLQRLVSRR